MAIDVDRIQKPVRKLRKLVKKISPDPTPEKVHDFRTSSRRMEATLTALSLDSKGTGRRILKPLSRLRKRAGKVRDMDVLTDYVSSIPHHAGENECSIRLLEHLGAKRQKHARKLHTAARRYSPKLRKRLKRISAELENAVPRNRSKSPDRNESAASVAASALHALSELARPPRLNKANLHPYRLKVKELRNLLQLADNSEQQQFIQNLGEVKDAIGEWHDWQELLGIADDMLDHGSNCRLLQEIKRTAEQKYNNALGLAENMRKKYLHVSDRKNGRAGRPFARGPAETVWLATAALVA